MVVVLCSCQAKIVVSTTVDKDGHGTVAVGLGLDDKAVAALGDPDAVIALDDMTATGWTLTEATKEPDGLTWIRATKPFTSPAELDRIMSELTGASGVFQGYTFTRVETDGDITYRVSGTVDPTKALASVSDPELTNRMTGDPVAVYVKDIEAKEGKPVADMVSFEITTVVAGGTPQTVRPTLRDTQPTSIDVATVEAKPTPAAVSVGIFLVVALVVTFLVAMLVGVRHRFRRLT